MVTLIHWMFERSGVVFDRDGGPATLPQDAAGLGEAARRFGEIHQAHVAEHRVEVPVREGEGLPVLDRHRHIRQPGEASPRPLDHSGQNVGRDDAAGRPDNGSGGLGGEAGAGGDVEHPLAGAEASRP
jgi:hypothetical protein